MPENSSFDFKEIFSKYWKWIVGGALALFGVVWVLRRQSGASIAAPVTTADPASTPAPAVDLSGVTAAIQGQNELIGSLASYVADTAAGVSGYQQNVTDLLKKQNDSFNTAISGVNQAVTATAASTSQAVAQVSQAVSSVNRTVADTVKQVTEAVKPPPATPVDSVKATEAVTAPIKPVSFGPALGFGGSVSDPATAAILQERATNPAYHDSEVQRTKDVIQNRLAAGLDIVNQTAYYKKLTGEEYVGPTK